jgi:hypothetical protein
MASLQTLVSQSMPQDTVDSTYIQTLENHRRSLLRASTYRSSDDVKKSRLAKELETYDEKLSNITDTSSTNYRTDLEQKIYLSMHDMPALDRFSFPRKREVPITTDFSLLMPTIKQLDGFFIETYSQSDLDRETYHSLRDLHRLTMDFLLFSYDTAQQNIGVRAIQEHLEKTIKQVHDFLSPLLHNADPLIQQVSATDSNRVENIKETLAERFFLEITNNSQEYKQKLVQKDSLIDMLETMTQRYQVDLTSLEGSLTPLEKISRKIEDPDIQQSTYSLIQNIKQRHAHEQQSYESPSFKEQAYNTITSVMLTDLQKQLKGSMFQGDKQQLYQTFTNAISATIHSDEFKTIIYNEIDKAIGDTGTLDSVKELIYGFHSVERKTTDYVSVNSISKGLYAKLQTFQRNLTRTVQEKDTRSAIDFLKRMEVTVEKAPSKFGSQNSILRSFISLFSKEAAHYFKLPDYTQSTVSVREQFSAEKEKRSHDFYAQLKAKDEQYRRHSHSYEFQNRYPQITELEQEIQKRVSGEFIREELSSVEPVFRSVDHIEHAEQIRDYMISLFMNHEHLRNATQEDESILTKAKQTLHTIYLQMYKLNTREEFDSFYNQFTSLIHKDSKKEPDSEYIQSSLLLTNLYMKDEGMDLSRDKFNYFMYRQAKRYWDHLGNEEKVKVDSYFAKRDAQQYKNALVEQDAA